MASKISTHPALSEAPTSCTRPDSPYPRTLVQRRSDGPIRQSIPIRQSTSHGRMKRRPRPLPAVLESPNSPSQPFGCFSDAFQARCAKDTVNLAHGIGAMDGTRAHMAEKCSTPTAPPNTPTSSIRPDSPHPNTIRRNTPIELSIGTIRSLGTEWDRPAVLQTKLKRGRGRGQRRHHFSDNYKGQDESAVLTHWEDLVGASALPRWNTPIWQSAPLRLNKRRPRPLAAVLESSTSPLPKGQPMSCGVLRQVSG